MVTAGTQDWTAPLISPVSGSKPRMEQVACDSDQQTKLATEMKSHQGRANHRACLYLEKVAHASNLNQSPA